MNSNPSICSLFGQQCVKYVTPVDAIVKRTGKVEVIGDERFERRTILADVCLITGAHDGNVSFVMSETRLDGNKIGDSLDTHEATNARRPAFGIATRPRLGASPNPSTPWL